MYRLQTLLSIVSLAAIPALPIAVLLHRPAAHDSVRTTVAPAGVDAPLRGQDTPRDPLTLPGQ